MPLTGPAPEEPVDVLVERGTVVEIAERLSAPAGVAEVDAAGRWLMPGLWDAHTHLAQWTLASRRLDLSETGSRAEVLAMVRAAMVPGVALIGWGQRSAQWEEPPTVAALDEVTGDTPVVMINADFHHGWCNSAALAVLGVPPRTEEQVVSEAEWFAVSPLLERLDPGGTSAPAYRAMLERTAALGVVGMVDFEFDNAPHRWIERWSQGCDLLRIRRAVYAGGLDGVLAAGWRTGDPLVPGEDRLRMGPLKIISDGSLGTRTAWCCAPYADDPSNHGAANQSPAELRELLRRAHAGGLQVATHAIGDRAAAEALAAYADTGAGGSIEHAQLICRESVAEMARLGLTASVQPAHLLDDRDVTDQVWPGRGERSFAFRWMMAAGVRLALGSDAPVAPLDPWLAIATAVHRSGDDRVPWHPEQALTVREALAASVDGRPTVAVGSLADFALLDYDPLIAPPEVLRAMPVALTTVAGEVVHSRL